jgi:hypothetical protein
MDIHLEILRKKTKNIFNSIGNYRFISDFYLAGGTALALKIGHRRSYDLDFFSQRPFNEAKIITNLIQLGDFHLEKKSEHSVIGILNEIKISFLGYPYPLLQPFSKINKINIADISDIACMKIDAIASRGTKRDFIDIYFISHEFLPLAEILKNFKRKYASLNYNMLHIKKSLVYFADADNEPMPSMLKPVNWREVKKFFKKEIMKI